MPLATALILLIPTLMYWAHERSVFADFQQSRTAQYRTRFSKRIQTEVDSQLRPLRRLGTEIALGDVASAEVFATSARSISREEPELKYIAWIDLDGHCLSIYPQKSATAVMQQVQSAASGGAPTLFARLKQSPEGMLMYSPGAAGATTEHIGGSDRIIVLPVAPKSGTGQSVRQAIVTCEATQSLLGAIIPPDASSPVIVEVKDERGRVLFCSDGATAPVAQELLRSQEVDPIRVLDQTWSMSLAAAPPGLGQRPASDTDAFLITGLIVALLGAATVAQAGRHRRRERQRTAEHLAALEALHAVAASISYQPRAEAEVLQRLLVAAAGLMRVPRAFVVEVQANQPATLLQAVGFGADLPRLERQVQSFPVVKRCIGTGQTLIDNSTDASSESAKLHIQSMFVFPLFAGDERIGVMALCDDKPRRFNDEDFRLARLWASQAAVTLANQRLADAKDEALQLQQRLTQQVRLDAEAKATLLRELNHRVKNNLAGIVGLLSAGVPELSDQAQHWLDRAIARIETLARAHELFVGTTHQIGLADLVCETLEPVIAIKPPGVQIKLELNGVDDPLTSDQAVTLAMVVNELASNALQHGLGDHGRLLITADRPKPGWAKIEVTDDGSAYPPEVPDKPGNNSVAVAPSTAQNARSGIGLQLVNGLVSRELHGFFSMRENLTGGTTAAVEFRISSTPLEDSSHGT
jgi:two-component sensor histidine kinase